MNFERQSAIMVLPGQPGIRAGKTWLAAVGRWQWQHGNGTLLLSGNVPDVRLPLPSREDGGRELYPGPSTQIQIESLPSLDISCFSHVFSKTHLSSVCFKLLPQEEITAVDTFLKSETC
ncbi:hypothetical protein J6590_091458 [Homalodisca vitripennis]|nr:hypothetical protein J6590_091458 [Homalodisca vitripennis]